MVSSRSIGIHISGGSSGYVLSTNGANTLSWIAPSSGATGATGIGATGATGTAGSNGSTGATGTAGTNGATGATGTIGSTGATGPVAGSNTQVIFNDAGSAGASANLTFNKSTNALTLTNGNLYSPTNNTGLVGGITVLGQGYVGSFSGSTQYLNTAINAAFAMGTGDFTAEAWFYWTGNTGEGGEGEQGILASGPTGNGAGFVIRLAGGPTTKVISWWLDGPSYQNYGSTAINKNQWYHVALVRSGSGTNNCKVYLNGGLESQATNNYNVPSNAVVIGRNYTNYDGEYFCGYISNPRIVKGVSVYTGNFTVPTAPLSATQSANPFGGANTAAITGTATSLLTLQNSTIIDNSSYALSITNNGTVTTGLQTVPFATGIYAGTILYDGSTWQTTAIQTTSLNVAVGNLHVSGGSSGYVLSTDGANTLSWISPSSGATGATGIGATGATGTAGSNGATGATGTAGSNGATGATGTAGTNGSTGATGVTGNDGATGATGTSGTNGATGATGTIGSTGATGPVAGSNTQVIFNDANAAGASANLTFDKTTNLLTVTGNANVTNILSVFGTAGTSSPTTVEYLVVAGGGGGGGSNGGGAGGAGGYRTATGYAVTSGQTIAVTVGAGGAGGTSTGAAGNDGSNSVFGSLTSTGGGGGGSGDGSFYAGRSGGSGGGGASQGGNNGSGGTASPPGQGNAGGDGVTDSASFRSGAGGGGAGVAGSNATGPSSGGQGGNGLQSSITGTATYYAGGGAGAWWSGTNSVAGLGGGGTQNVAGTANTGGGGGGGTPGNGRAGGSGVVIIRYPDSYAAASATTGTVTYTVSGGYRVYKFTSSGTITFPDTNQNSTSTSTGSLIVYGGVGIAKDVYTGGLINATGNITGSNVLTSGNVLASGNVYTSTTNTGLVGGSTGTAYIGTFAGTNDISVPYASQYIFGTSNFTIEFWIKPTTAGIQSSLFTNGPSVQFYYDNGTIIVNLSSNGGSWNISDAAISCTTTVGSWSHIALVRNGSVFTLYKNGTSTGTVTSALGLYNPSETVYFAASGFIGIFSNYRVAIGVAVYTATFTTPTGILGSTQSANTNGNPSSAITGTQTKLLAFETANASTDGSTYAATIASTGVTMSFAQSLPFGQPQGTFLYDGSTWQATPIQTTGLNVAVGNLHVSGGSSGYVLSTDGANTLSWISPSSGATGATGIGATGATGVTGATGTAGSNGATGATGVTGNDGATGATGTAGSNGATGATGTSGTNGATGATGTSGTNGATGATGTIGSTGATGPVAGSNTQVIFNDANAAGASANLTFNKSTNALTLTNGNLVTPTNNTGLVGGVTLAGQGYVGSFNGSSQYLSVASNAAFSFGTGDFTLEAWIYLNTAATGTDYRIFTNWGGGGDSYQFYLRAANNRLIWQLYSQNSPDVAALQITPFTWTHVAFCRSGTTIKTFINGALADTTTGVTNSANGTGTPTIGADTGGGNYFPGYISNLRIVKSLAVYTGAFTVPTAPLSATQSANPFGGANTAAITGTATSLLTLQSSTIIDNSTNGFTITNTGGVTTGLQTVPFGSGVYAGTILYDGSTWQTTAIQTTSLNVAVANLHVSGGSSGYVLSTDGANTLSWISPSSGATGATGIGATGATGYIGTTGATGVTGNDGATGATGTIGSTGATGPVAGSNTQVIFNDAGAAGASANLTFDKTTNILTVAGNIIASNFVGTLANGNSNVYIGASNGNVTVAAVGNTTLTVTGTGINVAGYANFSGNTNIGGNINVSGNIITASGTGGNLTGGNLISANSINISANANFSTASNVSLGSVSNVHITGGTAGYVLTTDGSGTLSWNATGSPSSISNGNSNVNIATANGNITLSAVGNANIVVVTGTGVNIAGTLNTGSGNINTTGNISGAYFIGNGSQLTGISSGASISNGTSNVNIATANGNVTTTSNGNTTLTITDLGANITGYANITGNVNASNINVGNANITGTVTLGAGSGGDLTGANLLSANSINISANANFSTASNVSLGSVNNVHITGGTAGYVLTTDGAGSLSWNATGSPSSISNGNSNVNIATANGNITLSAVGNANIVVVTGTGANITGYANITGNVSAGNVSAGNANISGTVTLGAGSGGDLTGANLLSANSINISANANFSTASNVSLGSVSNVHIDGGTGGYVLTTDGAGNLSWAAGGGGGGGASIANGNSNVNINTANGNITMSAVGNANIVVVTGTGVNIAGTLDTGSGNINTTGNVSGAYFVGNGSLLTGIVAGAVAAVANGNSNVNIPVVNGNITFSANGNANVMVVDGTGNVTIGAGIGGSIVGANYIQSNVLSVTGNATAANVLIGGGVGGAITGANSISANYFVGNGSLITGITVANGNSNVSAPIANGNITISVTGNANVVTITNTGVNITGTLNTGTANITANYYIGNGALLTGIAATTSIANGNSNVSIPTANGNVNISAIGNANILVVTGTGANILGTANITGNLAVTGTNVTFGTGAGGNISGVNVVTANTFAQGNSNITVVSNANVNFSVTGTANIASITAAGIITTVGNGAITSNAHTASGVATGNSNVSTITGNLGFRSLFTTYTEGNAVAAATIANAAIHAFAAPNLAAANTTVTFTNAATMYIAGGPVANTNATITNSYALMVGGNARFFGNITGTLANGNSNVYIAAANGNVTVAAVGNTTLTISGTGVNVAGTGNFSGNLTAGNFVGLLASGNSNINMVSNANVAIAVTGANRLVVTSTGANIAGTANITGNLVVGNLPIMPSGNSNITITSNANISMFTAGNATAQFVVTTTGANIAGTANVVGNVNIGANLRVTGQGGLGYNSTIGANTQLTSRNTAVTISNVTGAITLFSSTTTANTVNVFTVTNT